MTQKKLNNIALGFAPLLLILGIDSGDGNTEFFTTLLDDLSVARVMEEMAAAGWFTVRVRA
ncbi:MAG: hypothetical protein ACK53L_32985, partial [Pirellulaceae bacterium]